MDDSPEDLVPGPPPQGEVSPPKISLTTGRNESKFVDPLSIMLDGIRIKIALQHPTLPLKSESRYFGTDGEVFRNHTRYYVDIDNFRGASVRLRSMDVDGGTAGSLIIEGNPAKWLQGHNLFGACDLLKVVPFFVTSVLWRYFLRPLYTVQEWDLIVQGEYEIFKVSLNHQFKLKAVDTADRAMRLIGELALKGKQGKMTRGHEYRTVYFGADEDGGTGDAYLATRIYHKGREVHKHPLPDGLPIDEYGPLNAYAAGLIRFEYDFLRDFIRKRGLTKGRDWTPDMIHRLVNEQFESIYIPRNIPISDHDEVLLPRRPKEIYNLWRSGLLQKADYGRSTFFSFQAQLKPYGIDIAQPPSVHVVPNDMELFTPERAARVPDWAIENNLYFDPIARLRLSTQPIVRVSSTPSTDAESQTMMVHSEQLDHASPTLPQSEVTDQEVSIMSNHNDAAPTLGMNPGTWFTSQSTTLPQNQTSVRNRRTRRSQASPVRKTKGVPTSFTAGVIDVVGKRAAFPKIAIALSGTVRLIPRSCLLAA